MIILKNFLKLKKNLNSKFPVTKIQMILTKDSRNEVENFYKLFKPHVDEVTVTQYNERGGNLEDLDDKSRSIVENYISAHNLPKNTPHMVDFDGNIFIFRKQKTL